jgi:hypothetical protein
METMCSLRGKDYMCKYFADGGRFVIFKSHETNSIMGPGGLEPGLTLLTGATGTSPESPETSLGQRSRGLVRVGEVPVRHETEGETPNTAPRSQMLRPTGKGTGTFWG